MTHRDQDQYKPEHDGADIIAALLRAAGGRAEGIDLEAARDGAEEIRLRAENPGNTTGEHLREFWRLLEATADAGA